MADVERSEAMSGADAAWLRMDRPNNLMVVETMLRFDMAPDWDAVETAFSDRVVQRFARFRQRAKEPVVTIGQVRPQWQPCDDVVVGDHVRRTTIAACDVLSLVAAESARPLDRRRPLWSLTFADVDDGTGLLLLRTHHAMADGAALVKVLHALDDRGGPARHAADSSRPRRSTPIDVGPTLKMTERAVRRNTRNSPFTAPLDGTKSVAQHTYPTRQLRLIAAAMGATINDVLLASVGRALGSMETEAGGTAPRHDVVMPIDLRDDGDGDTLGNSFGLAFVELPSGGPPTEHLRAVAATTNRIKHSSEAVLTSSALSVLGHLPRAVQQGWIDSFIDDSAAVVTNVRGPADRLTIAGAEASRCSALVPSTATIGLGISLFTYDGTATISVLADTAVTPHAAPLADAIDAAIGELTAAAPNNP